MSDTVDAPFRRKVPDWSPHLTELQRRSDVRVANSMGQTSSVRCCCGSGDKRASEILNDSLQEKLLEGEITHVTVDTRRSSDQFHKSIKQSSTRNAGVATTEDADRYSEEYVMRGSAAGRESSINGDDVFDDRQQQSTDEYTSHGWNQSSGCLEINDTSRVDFDDSSSAVSYSHQQHEISARDRSVIGARIPDLSTKAHPPLERDDSYASSQEQESELAREDDGGQDNDQDEDGKLDRDLDGRRANQDDLLTGALRFRSIARPSSSRVFDDEDDNSEQHQSRLRGLTELSDHAEDSSSTLEGFGSFGSDSSRLQSFAMRDSETSAASARLSSSSFVESHGAAAMAISSSALALDAQEEEETATTDAPPSPTHGSPRSKKNKKKTKKNRR